MTARDVQQALRKLASAADAQNLQRFFKTAPGQYGAGDVFIGVRMPQIRQVCRQYRALPLPQVQHLLDSQVHEDRMAALIILTLQYPGAQAAAQQAIFDMYMHNVYAGRVNNWDLVDVTAHMVVGAHLVDRPRDVLFALARSNNVWQKRVALLSSFRFMQRGDASTTLALVDILLHDPHDLIQKAVGWMLREIGKRVDRQLLLNYLDQHAHDMPRTALRYAIEHLPPSQRAHYLGMKAAGK